MSTPGVPIATAAIRLVGDATGLGSDIVRKATPEIARANRTLSEHSQLLGAGSASARDFRRGILAASLSLTGLRGAVLAAGTGFLGGAGLINAMRMFIGLSAQFERSMNEFQAVTHATSGELRDARQEAVALGNDIRLPQTSAADAAQSMTELARGGLDVTESMHAARGALQLAAAAGSDFATAAQIQARSLNAFALGGDQAVRVADVLANTANISSGEIQDFALALQQSAAVAHQANFSIEDTAAALAELANAGITGSDAGTSLRTMILRLVPQTTKAAAAMKDLKVRTTDANGEFLPLTEIIRRYGLALQRLSPEQRNLTLQTIFGQDAIRASNILFSSGSDIFNRYRDAVDRAGGAAALAASKNKGLAGTFDALRSNVESILISTGQRALPGLTGFVRGINDSVSGLQHSGAAADALKASADALFTSFHAVGDVVRALGPPLELVAKLGTGVAGFLGGAPILAFVAGMKILPATLKAVAAGQQTVSQATQIANGHLVVMRRTNEEVAAGAKRLFTTQAEGVTTSVALFESQTRVATGAAAQAEAEAAAASATSTMAKADVAAAEAKLAAMNASERYVAGLTGLVAAEEAETVAAREAAIAETGLTEARLAAAIASQKAAVAAQAAVALPQQRVGPGFGFASTVEKQNMADLARLEAGVDRELVQAELSAGRFKRTLNSIGTGALAAVGGEVGALIIGFSALGLVITKLIQSSSNEFDKLKGDSEALAGSISDITTRTDNLTRARADVKADRISEDEAKLNVQLAKGAVETARASGSAQELKSAQLQLQRSLLQLEDAERAYRTALETRAQAQIAAGEASKKQGKAQRDEISAIQGAFAKAFEREAQIPQTLAEAEQNAVREVNRFLDNSIAKNKEDNPLYARKIELVKEFIAQTGHIPSQRVFNLIFKVRSVTENVQTPDGLLLGESERIKRRIMTGIESARAQARTTLKSMADQLSPIARFAGTKAGEAYALALAEGIQTKQSVAAAAARRAVHTAIIEGQREIDQAIIGAESNLISIGTNISEQIAQLIDQGPLGQRVKQLQSDLEKARRAAQRLELTQGLRDAQRDLTRARQQLDPTQEIGLTPAQVARRRQSAQDFLRPFIERRDQAKEALHEFTVEGIIEQLQKAQQAQKDAVVKGIGDVIAAFAAGKIKADDAIAQLARIIGGSKHQNNFKNAGKNLGNLFVLGFGGAVQSLFEQITEIGKVSPARRARAGLPRPDVERPAETIARVRREILAAEEKRRVATLNNTKEIKKLTEAILLSIGRGTPGGKAQRQAAKGQGRVVNTPPPPRGLRGNR